MKEHFENWNPNTKSRMIVTKANEIIQEYQSQGYVLTVRQLYYQFVARDLIPNNERSYKNLVNTVTKGRMAGLISWAAIEDRNRKFIKYWTEEDIRVPIRKLPLYIRFDQWARQDTYVEVWVEKEALGNVVDRACVKRIVPHIACKGYMSASALYNAGKRFERQFNNGKNCVLIHLGDHDPSGIDMTRDNAQRVKLLSNQCDIAIERIALNYDQIQEYSPPPNPTKVTDSRAKKYMKLHGNTSWELDALEPSVIENLISDTIDSYIDEEIWDDVDIKESIAEYQLSKIDTHWSKVKELLEGLE